MKVLMISGDVHFLEKRSEAHARLELQRSQVSRLDVFVWPQMHSQREIFLAAQKNKYNVITAQDPFWRGLLAYRIAKRTGTKLNLQVHTDLSSQPLCRRWFASFLLRRADSVRVVSEKTGEQVRALGVKAKISILPVYIDIHRFQNIVPKKHEQKTILWVGRFEQEKDPRYALQVLKEVRQSIDAKLVMLGAGSLEPALRREGKMLPVSFPGWQDPLPYLQVADIVLCTSQHESWGASIIEALAAGVPVVAPDVGIAREAGAVIAQKSDLWNKVVRILNSGQRGELKIPVLSAEEWAKHWQETLV
jgi:glycosyltransferase involved in cell wall biosynthesis